MFTKISEVKQRLDRFFKFRDQKVLLFKGAWGSGKSHFVKDYLRERMPSAGVGSILPDWIAYTSIFGCTSIQQIEDRIMASFEHRKSWNKPGGKALINLLKQTAKEANFSLLGLKLPLPLNSLLWYLVKTKEVLIIIDDVERVNSSVELASILGLVSSLAENALGIKVIIICNVTKLSSEGPGDLARYREKVIHQELLYCPPPKELVSYFFCSHKEQADTLVWCLEAMNEPNIRIIFRVADALTNLKDIFLSKGINLSSDACNNIVRICVLFLKANCQINQDWLSAYHVHDMMRSFDRNRDKETEAEDPSHILCKKLEVTLDHISPVVIEWLNDGTIHSGGLLEATCDNIKARSEAANISAQIASAYAPYTSNFRAITVEEVTDPVIRLLDRNAEILSIESLGMAWSFLSYFGISGDVWLNRHVQSKLSSFDAKRADFYFNALPPGEAKNLVEHYISSLCGSKNIREILWRINSDSSWTAEEEDYLASLDEQYYRQWLEAEEDQGTLTNVRRFLSASYSADSNMDKAHRTLLKALHAMAKSNLVNMVRYERFFKLSLQESNQEATPVYIGDEQELGPQGPN